MSDMAMKYEDWLRGCVHHDGRKGNVYLPCDTVLAIADWIEAHRDVAPVRHEEDGTLWVTVEDCGKVGRVIIKNELGHFCRVFYMCDGDEEPVRHGRWMPLTDCSNEGIYCSECHKKVYRAEYSNTMKMHSPYCPNCGARMDGESDE